MAQRVTWTEYVYLYGQSLRLMGRFTLWLPLLIHGLIGFLLLQMFYYMFSPVFGSLAVAVSRLINETFAPALSDYPGQFIALPYFWGTSRFWVNIVIEALLFGMVVHGMIKIYSGEKVSFGDSLKSTLQKYFQITIVWAFLSLLLYVINMHAADVINSVLGISFTGSPRRRMVLELGIRLITVLFYALFIFIIPSIMAGGERFGSAIKRGFGVFFRHPVAAFSIILIPYLIGFLPSWLATKSDKIVANFNPEMVYYLLIVSIIVDVIVNFILLGTSVKLFIDRQAE